MSQSQPTAAAGIYGKLPSYRDFLRRGLSNRFVLSWDNWLAHAIKAAQELLGDQWMQAYLTSPPWRFALDPQLVDAEGWCGVVLSSVDTVHRCFPLTIAAGCAARFADFLPFFDCDGWMGHVETLALALIEGSRDADALANDLDRLAKEINEGASFAEAPTQVSDAMARWADAVEIVPMSAGDLPPIFSYWWHDDWPGHPAVALRCRGLPPALASVSFFDSAWADRRRGELSPLRLP